MTTARSSSPSPRRTPTPTPSRTSLGRRLGAGGEAEVFEVEGEPTLAFKRHHHRSAQRDRKLAVMAANPLTDLPSGVVVAWPRTLHADGFTMARAPVGAVPLVSVYNPQSRARLAPGFGWRHLLRTALNVARTIEALHAAGVVVGDINESNLLVDRRARIALVDCDSVQIADPMTGEVHRCTVGRPEFLAPELHGVDLGTVDRVPSADTFALAVLVFQLLLDGRHPFAGVWRGAGDPPDLQARMRRAAWPHRRLDPRSSPAPYALGPELLPYRLRRLFGRTFGLGCRRPGHRPSATRWVTELERVERSLRPCRRSAAHIVPGRLRRCPWCARVDAGLPDPFPGPDGRGVPRRRRWLRTALRSTGTALAMRARGVAPLLTGVIPAAIALVAIGAAAPLVGPFLLSVGVLPALAGPAVAAGRRRWSPWRLLDARHSAVEGLRTLAAATVGAGAAAAFLGTVGGLDVPGHARSVVQGASGAIMAAQGLRAPAIVPAWTPVLRTSQALRRRRTRVMAAASWTVAGASVVAALSLL